MNTILTLFASNGWSRLVMVLLHSLWQGGLIALGLWILMRKMPARNTSARYASALASLLALVFGALITGSILGVRDAAPGRGVPAGQMQPASQENAPAIAQTATLAAGSTTIRDAALTPLASSPGAPLPGWMAWAAMLWLAGCALMSIRLLTQWLDLRRITAPCLPVADRVVMEILARLQTVMGMKQNIRILSGDHISGPSVYGMIAPKLLLPPALLLGVPVEQLEAIIAHELAHIRRHDYLVNLVQQFVEAALFFNPAVWWINRQIRVEREACCDRLAVEVTGNPEAYAWSLEAWAEKQRETTPVLAPAFGARRHPDGPLERLKRLLVSEYRPSIRMPWHSFFGMVAMAGILFLGLCQGTHIAVGYAAEWLTPTQRIEKLTQIQKTFGQPEASIDNPPSSEKVLVTGTVERENGSLVESDATVSFHSRSSRNSTCVVIATKTGRFEQKVPPGKIFVAVFCPDYAPVFLGPFEGASGGKIEGIKAVMLPGYSARIKAIDPNGSPLTGAQIDFQYQHPAGGYAYGHKTTGPDGIALFDHLSTNAILFKITARGYEYDECKMSYLKPGDPYLWKLAPAKISPGTVVAARTGKPVEGAKLRLLSRERKFSMSWGSPESSPVLGVSDGQGKFQLDTLNDEALYTLVVYADGFAPLILREIAPGQSLIATLEPQIDIKGKVIGVLSSLPSSNPQAHLDLSVLLDGNSSHSQGRDVPIQIRDGIGYFEFTNVFPGSIELRVGNYRTNMEVGSSIDNLTVDLNTPPSVGGKDNESGPTREVVLKLRVPKDHPPLSGPFKYDYWSDATHRGQTGVSAFTNGTARVSIPVPGGISMDSAALSGCWIERLHQSIAPASSSVEIEVAAFPSGAIYGKVVDSDGAEVSDMMVSVLEAAKSPFKKSEGSLGVEPKNGASTDDGPTRFTAQPLPLGGKYIIMAHRKWPFAASEPITLTEAQPICEIVIQLAPGLDFKGTVLDPARQPVSRAEVTLTYNSGFSYSFGGPSVYTDKEGVFQFERVNPRVPGSYQITVRNVPGYQPLSKKIDIKAQQTVLRLKKGLRLEGIVLDRASGNPIPHAEVTAWPQGEEGVIFGQSTGIPSSPGVFPVRMAGTLEEYPVNLEARTDANGRFVFTGMANRRYQIRVNETEIPTTIVRGGQKEFVTMHARPFTWSKLKPVKKGP